jgi:hypothetical protein
MPPPITLVLAQLLTSTLSNDSSVAELLRRQVTFLEDTTLPAALQARGAAIFHHALFTETPNAIHAGEPVVEILRKTVVRAGELYLENERGPVVKSEGDDGVGVEQAAKHGGDEDEEEGVQDGEAARMGQAMKDDRRTAKETSARAGRKRTRKEEEEDSSVDDPDGDDFNAESQRYRRDRHPPKPPNPRQDLRPRRRRRRKDYAGANRTRKETERAPSQKYLHPLRSASPWRHSLPPPHNLLRPTTPTPEAAPPSRNLAQNATRLRHPSASGLIASAASGPLQHSHLFELGLPLPQLNSQSQV